MRIGCLFGTFDPPHYGHTAIAAHMLEETDLEEVWLVISPQSPFKQGVSISPEGIRLEMVKAAVSDLRGVVVCDIELTMPKPNYTVDTLNAMRSRWPGNEFTLVLGSDNLAGFDRWKDADRILAEHRLYVYPRPGVELHLDTSALADHPSVTVVDAPFMTVSATRIREMVRTGQDVSGMVAPAVDDLIRREGLYTT